MTLYDKIFENGLPTYLKWSPILQEETFSADGYYYYFYGADYNRVPLDLAAVQLEVQPMTHEWRIPAYLEPWPLLLMGERSSTVI